MLRVMPLRCLLSSEVLGLVRRDGLSGREKCLLNLFSNADIKTKTRPWKRRF